MTRKNTPVGSFPYPNAQPFRVKIFESVKQGVEMFGEAGMQMMLKSLGIDPKQLMEFAASLKSVVEDLNKRLQTIENQQKEIKALLESLQVEVRDE